MVVRRRERLFAGFDSYQLFVIIMGPTRSVLSLSLCAESRLLMAFPGCSVLFVFVGECSCVFFTSYGETVILLNAE
uniref:Uncharacterized protein n=1 Tax=Angiostrongylus cantonensis TaxID=6313 RepID=A0A0K0DBH3_ANGCA